MTLYRCLGRLSMPGGGTLEKGALDTLAQLPDRVIKALLERGRIAPVASPPLADIAPLFWGDYGSQLEGVGVVDLADLVAMDEGELAQVTHVSREEAGQWRDSARALLVLDQVNNSF